MNCSKIIKYIFWFPNIYFKLKSIQWFLTFKKADLQETKKTRIMDSIGMKFGKPLLLWTLILMVPTVFENFDFQANLSQSIILRRRMRFLGSRMWLWSQFFCTYTIFGPQYDDLKVFRKFETFGKFRNKIRVPPICWSVQVSNRTFANDGTKFYSFKILENF